jgi:hypothetical protein
MPSTKRRGGKPTRPELKTQRSETSWSQKRSAARTPHDRACVEWDRLRQKANRQPDPAATWNQIATAIRQLVDQF